MTLAKSFTHFSLALHKQKIILGENGPIKKIFGAQDDLFANSMPRHCR